MKRKPILLIGYGNPARLDDGIGPKFAEAIRQHQIPDTEVETYYLLNIELADQISRFDIVIFADADMSGPESFYFRKIEPQRFSSFSSHHMSPAGILGLTHKLYQINSVGYVMGIRGYFFDGFGEKLSDGAERNLIEAVRFLVDRLRSQDFSVSDKTASLL